MKKIFAANWKLNKTPSEARAFVQKFSEKAPRSLFEKSEVVIFPQSFSLEAIAETVKTGELKGSIHYGPQNVHTVASGAFTGENSAVVAKELGSQFVLLGHSERRQFFAETNGALSEKVKLVQELGLIPMLCVGETLAEREAGRTGFVLDQQIREGLRLAVKSARFVIAYEPVWAIGTGKVATLTQVKEAHEMIFNLLATLGFKDFQILYGGSVKPDNATELLSVPHVDGFLVGGAALEVDSFLKICHA